jgi:hypothetical protein
VIASGPVFVHELNAAQLEQFVTRHPLVGVRLIRSMAERVVRETSRH